jgi:hypothetical protein
MNLEQYKLNLFKETKITNRRQELLKEIIDEINKERIDTKYKPVSPKAIAIKCSHLKEQDLNYFISICKDYKHKKGSFSKCFFGALKNK